MSKVREKNAMREFSEFRDRDSTVLFFNQINPNNLIGILGKNIASA